MTERLYYQDPYMLTFEATVVNTLTIDGQPAVVLDKTAFYPTSGGQPHDTGTLNTISVIDVVEQNGEIVHILSANLADSTVIGQIDRARRMDHMQQHAGQHILSKTFELLYDSNTIGFHISSETSTVDIEIAEFTELDAKKVEEKTNEIIMSNVPIKTYFPSPLELQALPLRKPPAKTENIRIVHVSDWDCCACGGTHPHSTGEIGLLFIRRWEKHRSGIRVEFVCGSRALHDYQRKNQYILELASLTSMPETGVVTAVQKLLLNSSGLQKTVNELQNQLLSLEADNYLTAAGNATPRVIAKVLQNRNAQELKNLAVKLTAQPQTYALLGTSDGSRAHLVFQRSADLQANMGALLQQALPMIDGKGGGSPQSAQGGGTNPAKLTEAIEIAASQLSPNY